MHKEYRAPRKLGAISFRELLEIKTKATLLVAMNQGVRDRGRHGRDIVKPHTIYDMNHEGELDFGSTSSVFLIFVPVLLLSQTSSTRLTESHWQGQSLFANNAGQPWSSWAMSDSFEVVRVSSSSSFYLVVTSSPLKSRLLA